METETIGLSELDGLSVRTLNALNRGGYETVDELRGIKAAMLMDLPNFGRRGFAELERELEAYGITFVEPVLTVRALVDALRHGPLNDTSCAHQVGFPKGEVKTALAILVENGVADRVGTNGATIYRLNPFFLRFCVRRPGGMTVQRREWEERSGRASGLLRQSQSGGERRGSCG